MDTIWVVLIIVCVLGLYILPSIYAAVRQTSMMVVILLLDILLGWTVLGWFAALALAVLLPSTRVQAAAPATSAPPSEVTQPVVSTPAPGHRIDFLVDPKRVAVGSLLGPVVYEYWWFWRFFQFARRERLAHSRSFWWILVPFYGYVVIGRLFHDLQSRLGPSRPSSFNAQTALALIVAANAAGGMGLRLGSLPFLVGGLALSCVFTAIAFYQVQSGVNAYLRLSYPEAADVGVFPGEAVAVVAGLACLGLLVLGGGGPTPSNPTGQSTSDLTVPTATATPQPTATATAAPIPSFGDVLSMTSQPGDYIGQGTSMTMTPPDWRFIAGTQNGPGAITVTVESASGTSFVRWTVWLGAPVGQSLVPGTYLNAERAAFRSGSAPGLDVFGDGRGCNQVFGSFTITSLTIDSQGNVRQLNASFKQHCESPAAPALSGSVHIG